MFTTDITYIDVHTNKIAGMETRYIASLNLCKICGVAVF